MALYLAYYIMASLLIMCFYVDYIHRAADTICSLVLWNIKTENWTPEQWEEKFGKTPFLYDFFSYLFLPIWFPLLILLIFYKYIIGIRNG